MLVRILIDGMAKMMNGLRLNKYIEAFFYLENRNKKIEVINRKIQKGTKVLQLNRTSLSGEEKF